MKTPDKKFIQPRRMDAVGSLRFALRLQLGFTHAVIPHPWRPRNEGISKRTHFRKRGNSLTSGTSLIYPARKQSHLEDAQLPRHATPCGLIKPIKACWDLLGSQVSFAKRLRGFLVVALIVWSGFGTSAAPLKRSDVGAEPVWVLHINCDALRPTAVGKYLLSEMQKPDVEPQFAAFQGFFSFDPRKQLHGLTFYSTGNATNDGVMLCYADFDPGRLVALAKSARNSQITNYGNHVIYSWLDERTAIGKGKIRFYASIEGNRVLFGEKRSRVEKALDVLDRAQSNLSDSKAFPQMGAEGDANFLEAAARKIEIPGATSTAALFRLASAMDFQLNESNHVVTANLNFHATTEDVARQAVVAVQSVAALAKMQSEHPEAGKLAQVLSVKRDGSLVVATLAMPEVEVIDMLKAAAEKEDPKKADKERKFQ